MQSWKALHWSKRIQKNTTLPLLNPNFNQTTQKELEALFDYLNNKGIVRQKDVLKLVDLAPTKLVKKQLKDIGDKLGPMNTLTNLYAFLLSIST